MPQPRLAETRKRSTAPVEPPAEDQRATVYCDGCGGYHDIDADTRSRWLAYWSIEHDDELAMLAATFDALNHALQTLGPVADRRDGNGNLTGLLDAGQEYIESLSMLLYPSREDLGLMDLE